MSKVIAYLIDTLSSMDKFVYFDIEAIFWIFDISTNAPLGRKNTLD